MSISVNRKLVRYFGNFVSVPLPTEFVGILIKDAIKSYKKKNGVLPTAEEIVKECSELYRKFGITIKLYGDNVFSLNSVDNVLDMLDRRGELKTRNKKVRASSGKSYPEITYDVRLCV